MFISLWNLILSDEEFSETCTPGAFILADAERRAKQDVHSHVLGGGILASWLIKWTLGSVILSVDMGSHT